MVAPPHPREQLWRPETKRHGCPPDWGWPLPVALSGVAARFAFVQRPNRLRSQRRPPHIPPGPGAHGQQRQPSRRASH